MPKSKDSTAGGALYAARDGEIIDGSIFDDDVVEADCDDLYAEGGASTSYDDDDDDKGGVDQVSKDAPPPPPRRQQEEEQWHEQQCCGDRVWYDRYDELVAYDCDENGGLTRVLERYNCAPWLQNWAPLQRRQMKLWRDGRPTRLTEDRMRLLKDIGLECNIHNHSTWMYRFVSR